LSIIFCYPFAQGKAEEQKRAMTFLDIIQMRHIGDTDISPDGKWFIYTISVPDWEKNKRFSDIYIVPLTGGKTKQMTFTKDKEEDSPKWYKDSSFFAFLSDRLDDKNQIYFMRPDGGEAWQVTDDKYGISNYEWSLDGKYLSYLGGKPEERQIWIMPGEGGDAEKLTDHKTPIGSYLWSPNSKKIYFTAPDSVDLLDKERKEKGFGVRISDQVKPPSHLWEIDIHTKEIRQLTEGFGYSVYWPDISTNGTRICFAGSLTKRYATAHDNEVFLLDLKTNAISQITDNSIWEVGLFFSPNSKWFSFVVSDGGEEFLDAWKICVTPSEGGDVKKLLGDFDYDPRTSFWSDDSKSIYFIAQVGVNNQLFSVSIEDDKIEQITNLRGEASFKKDEDSGKFLISYSDPENPGDYYYSEPENFADRDKWIKLTDINPQAKKFLLGKYETIRWRSTDGTTVEGLLIKPINYKKDRKYPLIVQLHGGPVSASSRYFEASWWEYVHVYAANDYVVFQPNYRGSKGYGKEFKKAIAKDYFGLSFDDIMTGVDYLIERNIVDPDRMGVMGWSAGGDFSNWALVSTDRFKAISTGAGTVFSYGWKYWAAKANQLDYIENAQTPTLIHFGENDYKHHGDLLHKELKKLGVPTEYIVYPNMGHRISDMRYQMVKMQAEFNWFEKWIRGKEGWIDWKEMIETLEKEKKE
jgi:dipeptidyl aminopeptidase/acylaminoacyl peptidase